MEAAERFVPRVSIITPSFNQGEFLEETIKSVIAQKYPNLEYIIIDGGSTDNSVEIIRAYADHISFWCSEKDRGQCDAINKGLRMATGDYIGWINSDDIYYHQTLVETAAILAKNPDADIVFGNYDYIARDGAIVHRRREIPYDFRVYFWTSTCYHANVAALFRKRCFEQFGLLREDLHYSMDFELYLRFGFKGCKFAHTDRVLGAYRLHDASKTVVAYGDFRREAMQVRKELAAKIRPSRWKELVFPLSFVIYRFARKLGHGCYSVGNIVSLKTFRKIKQIC